MPQRRPSPPTVEILLLRDGLDGPVGAAIDLLRVVNLLAAARGARRPAIAWRCRDAGGRAVRRAGAAAGGRGAATVMLVPGWAARNGPHLDRLVARDRAAALRLAAAHAAGTQVAALYTGVALLGEAGLLHGRRAAVPWPFVAGVLRHADGVRLAEGESWVGEDGVWSADSPLLATELLLRVLSTLGLGDLAESARSVLLPMPERQRLVGSLARDATTRVGPGSLERALRWLEDHLHEPYRLGAVAQAAATSPRSLLRHFKAAYGETPLQRLHALRVTRARMLLETTYLPVDQVAERCGWRDVAMLREAFRRATGTTPAAYRERYRLRVERRQWGRDLQR